MVKQIVDRLLTSRWWYFTLHAPYAPCYIVYDHSSFKVIFSKFLSFSNSFHNIESKTSIFIWFDWTNSRKISQLLFVRITNTKHQLLMVNYNTTFSFLKTQTFTPNVVTSCHSKIILIIFSRFVFAQPSYRHREFRRKSIIFSSSKQWCLLVKLHSN